MTFDFGPLPILDLNRVAAFRRLAHKTGKDVLETVLTGFRHNSAARLEDLRRAFADADAAAIEQVAHALAGSAGTVGAALLAQCAVNLEALAAAGDLASCRIALAEVEAAHRTLVGEIATLLSRTRVAEPRPPVPEAYRLPGAAPAPEEVIRVLIADDHPVVRQGAELLLREADDIEVLASASDGAEAVRLAERFRPDVVLMNLMMPVMDGIAATAAIRRRRPETQVLVMTASPSHRVVAALRVGAIGYLSKCDPDSDYAVAVRRAARGEPTLPAEITRLLSRPLAPELTAREIEISSQVAQGLSNQQIASQLGIAIVTVRSHLRSAFQKLELSNRVQLALYAVHAGWTPGPYDSPPASLLSEPGTPGEQEQPAARKP